jgi:hypothetical protein
MSSQNDVCAARFQPPTRSRQRLGVQVLPQVEADIAPKPDPVSPRSWVERAVSPRKAWKPRTEGPTGSGSPGTTRHDETDERADMRRLVGRRRLDIHGPRHSWGRR